MHPNDVLRRLRYALDLRDAEVAALAATATGRHASPAQVSAWLRDEDHPDVRPCPPDFLAAVLDGLVLTRRGPRGDGPPPDAPFDNNQVLRKLRIAFSLEADDMLGIFALANVPLSKGELSALFRRRDQHNFRPCLDQLLRGFLAGLAVDLRGARRYVRDPAPPA